MWIVLTKLQHHNRSQNFNTSSLSETLSKNFWSSIFSPNRLLLFSVGSATIYTLYKLKWFQIVNATATEEPTVTTHSKEQPPQLSVANREKRFIRFSSVEYNNQIYMTPKDFLRSIIEAEPTNPNRIRRILTQKEIEEIQKNTPSTNKSSKMLFRDLRHSGMISYSEYMFLRSILTKPASGFKIAFDMLDKDSNQQIDKEEFLVMEAIFSKTLKEKRRTQRDSGDVSNTHFVNDDLGLQRIHKVDTTLQIHFFGLKGDKKLSYKDFERFMINLQLEVLEMEFNQYARGFPTITEHDFATILFRYTKLELEDYQVYSNRLKERLTEQHGIPFKDFYVFFQFLNNLEDFAIALGIYTSAGYQISEEEFERAVKICTGSSLNQHLVHTVFCLFDEDGDGTLSHGEFAMIMKHRLQRGSHSILTYSDILTKFKKCLQREIKNT